MAPAMPSNRPYRARLHDICAQLYPYDTLVDAVWKMREVKQAINDLCAKQELLRFKREREQ